MTKISDNEIIEKELSDLMRLYKSDEEGVFVDKDGKSHDVKLLGLAKIVINHPVILEHLNDGKGGYKLIPDNQEKPTVDFSGSKPSGATAYLVGEFERDTGRTYEKNSYGWDKSKAAITYLKEI